MGSKMFHFAGCCQPIPGEEIIGYITRGRGVTIHRIDCPAAQELIKQPERTVPVTWDVSKDQTFVVRLEVNVTPRRNILAEITESITDANTIVRGADIFIYDTNSTGYIVVEVNNLGQLERVLERIRKVKGVISVKRAMGGDHPAE
jgi:GTP pyrophosphokinase